MALGLTANALPLLRPYVATKDKPAAHYPFGWTELHIAVLYHHTEIEILEKLLVPDCELDVQDKTGWAPLHYAAVWGYLACVQVLVEHGANIFLKTHDQETAESLATKWEYYEVVRYLKRKKEEKAKQRMLAWRAKQAEEKERERMHEYQEDLERAFNRTLKKYKDRQKS